MENLKEINFQLISEYGCAPSKSHASDVGWDLAAAIKDPIIINPGEHYLCPTGIILELPIGTYGQVASRSGLALQGLIVLGGVIDSGYRGEIKIIIHNLNSFTMSIEPKQRIAQLLLLNYNTSNLTLRTLNFQETDRGEKGFGSSDK